MKKLILLFAVLSCVGQGMAQSFPNSSFETWLNYSSGVISLTDVALERPDGWYGSDSLAVYFAQAIDFYGGTFGATYSKQLTKTSDSHSGVYAARLQTLQQGASLLVPCIMSNAKMNVDTAGLSAGSYASAFTFHGGTPVTERISDVMAYVKYSVDVAADTGTPDSGRIVVAAMRKDTVIGGGQMAVGVLGTYTMKDVKIVYLDATSVPDTIVVAFFSSGANYKAGSALYVDDVSMGVLGVGNTQAENELALYPNPNRGAFTVDPTPGVEQWLALYSIDGRLVAKRMLDGTTFIDVANLPNGMYTYIAGDNTGMLHAKGKLEISK